mmetsp:Transcript_11555/g.14567  ORF Transcript_11555/g.14567 Transcript_11555/m.14567 type:complete len:157 (+) Transcript_11555:769-1239(+)
MLGEKSSLFTFAALSTSLAGTLILLFGAERATNVVVTGADGSEQGTSLESNVTTILILASNPLIIGIGIISMRKMKKMHESVVTSYMNLMLLVVMIVVVYATGSDLTPWRGFGWLGWLCLVALAFTNVGSQRFRFKAYQRSQVSRLQPLTPTQSIF